jgi:hypothetical protein
VGEGYFEHMLFAFRFSGRLFKAAGAALVHGLVPALCETTASQSIINMHSEIAARRAQMSKGASLLAATQPYRGRGAASS